MIPTSRWVLAGTVAVIMLGGGLGLGLRMLAGGEPTKPDPNSLNLVARGKVVYAHQCASCHGANLELTGCSVGHLIFLPVLGRLVALR